MFATTEKSGTDRKVKSRKSIIVKTKNNVSSSLFQSFSFIKRYLKYSRTVLHKLTLNMNQKINRCQDIWDKILFFYVETSCLRWHSNKNHLKTKRHDSKYAASITFLKLIIKSTKLSACCGIHFFYLHRYKAKNQII